MLPVYLVLEWNQHDWQSLVKIFIHMRNVSFAMANDYYWGNEAGIGEQKEFEASLPKHWKRLLEGYCTFESEQFRRHVGDNYEFRKIENDAETQAMKLYYGWDQRKPIWRLIVGKRYEIKDGKIASVVEHDDYAFKEFEDARTKTLELMRSLDS